MIMSMRANLRPVEAAPKAFGAAKHFIAGDPTTPGFVVASTPATKASQAARLPLQPRLPLNTYRGFTLVELLVSLGVLALLVFFVTSLVNSAATITTLGHKQMDADSQARQFLDRMAVD